MTFLVICALCLLRLILNSNGESTYYPSVDNYTFLYYNANIVSYLFILSLFLFLWFTPNLTGKKKKSLNTKSDCTMGYFAKCISSNHWNLLSCNIIMYILCLDITENFYFNISLLLIKKSVTYNGTLYIYI